VSAYLLTALAALLAGFAAGMATWQKSRRWCTTCGVTLSCQLCQPAPVRRTGARR
jgi:NADH pyrophosphatase NudC (nudix superfamily)